MSAQVNAQTLLCRVLSTAVDELARIVLAEGTEPEERDSAERALMACRAALEEARAGHLEHASAMVAQAQAHEEARQERARKRILDMTERHRRSPATIGEYLEQVENRKGSKRIRVKR